MLYFVSGASASGKSALAERICAALPGARIYIATMPVRTEEDERVVARHHALRAERGFAYTLERPGALGELPAEPNALLECLSTFTANRIFDGGITQSPDAWIEQLWGELQALLDRPGHTVVVSADVVSDGVDYGAYTEDYRRVLTALGVRLAARADCAVEAVSGVPVVHKGELPELF